MAAAVRDIRRAVRALSRNESRTVFNDVMGCARIRRPVQAVDVCKRDRWYQHRSCAGRMLGDRACDGVANLDLFGRGGNALRRR